MRPHALPERSPRLREDPHGRRRRVRRPDRARRRSIVDWAMRVGYRVSKLRQAKQPVPATLLWQHRLADKLVYSKVKARLGGRLRVANAGGAPLSREIAEFFYAIDILILEGYGLSEVTTAATVNRAGDFKFGTVGKPLPGVELEFADDGEILHSLEHRLRRLLPRRGGDEGDARRRRASCTPVTSGTWTRTASSSSPTARRTSSSRPAARTLHRRTWRTS